MLRRPTRMSSSSLRWASISSQWEVKRNGGFSCACTGKNTPRLSHEKTALLFPAAGYGEGGKESISSSLRKKRDFRGARKEKKSRALIVSRTRQKRKKGRRSPSPRVRVRAKNRAFYCQSTTDPERKKSPTSTVRRRGDSGSKKERRRTAHTSRGGRGGGSLRVLLAEGSPSNLSPTPRDALGRR